VKRLVAVVLGAVGITAWLRRRRHVEPEPSPADDLRARLAETKAEPEAAPERAPEPPAEDVATRRADVHDRARQAMAELRDESE